MLTTIVYIPIPYPVKYIYTFNYHTIFHHFSFISIHHHNFHLLQSFSLEVLDFHLFDVIFISHHFIVIFVFLFVFSTSGFDTVSVDDGITSLTSLVLLDLSWLHLFSFFSRFCFFILSCDI